jgi:hypothetical protein
VTLNDSAAARKNKNDEAGRMSTTCTENDQLRVAEAIRDACIKAALEGYEDASMRGLCHEGAWERAIDAMRALDLKSLLIRLFSDEENRTSSADNE